MAKKCFDTGWRRWLNNDWHPPSHTSAGTLLDLCCFTCFVLLSVRNGDLITLPSNCSLHQSNWLDIKLILNEYRIFIYLFFVHYMYHIHTHTHVSTYLDAWKPTESVQTNPGLWQVWKDFAKLVQVHYLDQCYNSCVPGSRGIEPLFWLHAQFSGLYIRLIFLLLINTPEHWKPEHISSSEALSKHLNVWSSNQDGGREQRSWQKCAAVVRVSSHE